MNLGEISVTVLTKNSAQHLQRVLSALEDFGEVLLYDTGSADNTLEIASKFKNVRIIQAPFIGFGKTHNLASDAAKFNWILSIDSDEMISLEALQEIKKLQEWPTNVYSFPRHNYYNGKWIKWCGWYPDRQVKLYNRKNTRFSEDEVHETVLLKGVHHLLLKGAIHHFPYEKMEDFLAKMQTYSSLFAKQYQGKRKSSLAIALTHSAFAFFKSYFLKRGLLGGYEGFVISLYNSQTAYYKYLKLKELNKLFKPGS